MDLAELQSLQAKAEDRAAKQSKKAQSEREAHRRALLKTFRADVKTYSNSLAAAAESFLKGPLAKHAKQVASGRGTAIKFTYDQHLGEDVIKVQPFSERTCEGGLIEKVSRFATEAGNTPKALAAALIDGCTQFSNDGLKLNSWEPSLGMSLKDVSLTKPTVDMAGSPAFAMLFLSALCRLAKKDGFQTSYRCTIDDRGGNGSISGGDPPSTQWYIGIEASISWKAAKAAKGES